MRNTLLPNGAEVMDLYSLLLSDSHAQKFIELCMEVMDKGFPTGYNKLSGAVLLPYQDENTIALKWYELNKVYQLENNHLTLEEGKVVVNHVQDFIIPHNESLAPDEVTVPYNVLNDTVEAKKEIVEGIFMPTDDNADKIKNVEDTVEGGEGINVDEGGEGINVEFKCESNNNNETKTIPSLRAEHTNIVDGKEGTSVEGGVSLIGEMETLSIPSAHLPVTEVVDVKDVNDNKQGLVLTGSLAYTELMLNSIRKYGLPLNFPAKIEKCRIKYDPVSGMPMLCNDRLPFLCVEYDSAQETGLVTKYQCSVCGKEGTLTDDMEWSREDMCDVCYEAWSR